MALIIGVTLLLRWGARPKFHRNQQLAALPKFIRTLHERCADGAVLIIEHEPTRRFVQFAKYGNTPDESYITLGFPDAPWSRGFYSVVDAELRRAGFIVNESRGTGEVVPRFLDVVNFAGPDHASEAARIVLAAMGLDRDVPLTMHFPNAASDRTPVEFKARAV